MYGQILDAVNKKPLANVSVDVWEASTNGSAASPNVAIDQMLMKQQVSTSNKTTIK